MATIKQIEANRRNAQRSTGPKTPEGKDKVRFNALAHGRRAESAVLPGEDQNAFNRLLAAIMSTWKPQDEMEKLLVEQIAVYQWKLARLDALETILYDPGALSPEALILANHRLSLTQARLDRSVSNTVADLERYRKNRIAHAQEEQTAQQIQVNRHFRPGIPASTTEGRRYYRILPEVLGLDGEWREIPREILGDFPEHNDPGGGADL
jgi:hypothetical protein